MEFWEPEALYIKKRNTPEIIKCYIVEKNTLEWLKGEDREKWQKLKLTTKPLERAIVMVDMNNQSTFTMPASVVKKALGENANAPTVKTTKRMGFLSGPRHFYIGTTNGVNPFEVFNKKIEKRLASLNGKGKLLLASQNEKAESIEV